MPRYIFLRTAWMKHYEGVNENDIPVGAGWWVNENEDGGEVYNFHPIRDHYYGFARIQMGRSLRIERVGAIANADSVNDITVVFFGRNPQTGGQYIIGWYQHATLYRHTQQLANNLRGNQPFYLTKAQVTNGYLVQEEDRIFEVPDDGPGQTNAWYVEEYNDAYLTEVKRYIATPENYIRRQPHRIINGNAWQRDAEKRKRIEIAAMDMVANYFAARRYSVEYRHTENLGWDLEATLNNQTLLLEVKGLSGEFSAVDFTPNEYLNTKRNRKHYRICVVSNTLSANKKLEIFYWNGGDWISNENKILQIREIVSARFINVNG